MLTTTEMINGSLTAATKTLKPLGLWGSSLKVFVISHPVGFLALTGSTVIGYGVYSIAFHKIAQKQKAKNALSSIENKATSTKQ